MTGRQDRQAGQAGRTGRQALRYKNLGHFALKQLDLYYHTPNPYYNINSHTPLTRRVGGYLGAVRHLGCCP